MTEWHEQDKKAFESAYKVHGKDFNRLKQAVPSKKLSDVICFYYKWKKQSIKTTVMDNFINRMRDGKTCSVRFVSVMDSLVFQLIYAMFIGLGSCSRIFIKFFILMLSRAHAIESPPRVVRIFSRGPYFLTTSSSNKG